MICVSITIYFVDYIWTRAIVISNDYKEIKLRLYEKDKTITLNKMDYSRIGKDILPLGFYSTKDFELREALKKDDIAYYYHKRAHVLLKIVILDVVIEKEYKYIKFKTTNETDLSISNKSDKAKILKEEKILSVHSNFIKV